MLSLVGLGLGGAMDLTLKGSKLIQDAEFLFAETYTTILPPGSLEGLAREHHRNLHLEPAPPASRDGSAIEAPIEGLLEQAARSLVLLPRCYVEEGGLLLEAARRGPTVLLVGGDPLSATTHTALRLETEQAGIRCQVVANSSIMTAAPGLAGLDLYRFGRTVTLVLPDEHGVVPVSPLELVQANLDANLHTLVLLDIRADDPTRPPLAMTANQGLELLTGWSGPLNDDDLAVAVARAGWPDSLVTCGKAGELLERDFGPPPHTLMIPAKLGPVEEEAMANFS